MTTTPTLTPTAALEQAHEDFHHLMQAVHELVCNAYAEAANDKERAALREFEIEVADATTLPDICDKLSGVRAALAKRHITDL